MKPTTKKILKGIALFSAFYVSFNWIGGADGLTTMEKRIAFWFSFFPNELADIISELICLGIALLMIYCFVSGLFRIVTFNQYIPVFEDKTSGGMIIRYHESYPNINRVLSYRESRLAGLSNEEGMQLMRDTAILDKLYTGYNVGSETQRVLSFAESKLASYSNERALNYLTNKL